MKPCALEAENPVQQFRPQGASTLAFQLLTIGIPCGLVKQNRLNM
jgi:hypothetical protein